MTATIAMVKQPKMNPRISLSDLVARLESADHTIAFFNTPLPEFPHTVGVRSISIAKESALSSSALPHFNADATSRPTVVKWTPEFLPNLLIGDMVKSAGTYSIRNGRAMSTLHLERE